MRKAFMILGLVAVTLLASADDAFAQRWGGGRGGWRGGDGRVQTGRGYYGGGYYGGGYYSPSYGYYNRPYYAPYYSYDYSTPDYYYPDAPEIRQSFYPAEQYATVSVTVPSADAQVWFDNTPTTQRGTQRTFHSPALQSGSNYAYTIKARWTENGQPVEQQRQVQVQPGRSVSVDFRANSGESVPRPIQK